MAVTTVQAPTTVRQIPESEMRRYFSKAPGWSIPVAIVGALFFLIGLGTLRSGGSFCLLVGLIVFAIGAIPFAMVNFGAKPTDQEYDAWVAGQADRLEGRARQKLNLLDDAQLVRPPLRVRGVILPTVQSMAAGEILFKKGKDGYDRFSINTVKFFFPTEHNLAAYSDIVDALHQGRHNEKTEEFFYQDIVGARTEDVSVTVVLDKSRSRTGTVSAKTFMLIASSGSTTGDTVAVKSIGNNMGFNRPNDDVDQTVNGLRTLLLEKKGRAQQVQQEFQQQQANQQAWMQQQMLDMQAKMLEQMQRMGTNPGTGTNPGAGSYSEPGMGPNDATMPGSNPGMGPNDSSMPGGQQA